MHNEIQLLFFGSLVDIVGSGTLTLHGMNDTDLVQIFLKEQYPKLNTASYFIAVNQKIIQANTPLKIGDTVALMPPFSGG